MRYNKDGTRTATSVFEAAAWHYAVKVTCGCGHSVTYDPHGFWWHCEQRRWDMRFAALRRRFYCRICEFDHRRKVRPVTIEPVAAVPDITLPMPPEHVWRREISRWRC